MTGDDFGFVKLFDFPCTEKFVSAPPPRSQRPLLARLEAHWLLSQTLVGSMKNLHFDDILELFLVFGENCHGNATLSLPPPAGQTQALSWTLGPHHQHLLLA